MNFKKEYEKAFSDISAGEDFKKQLVAEMNRGQKVRRFPIRTVGTVAVAAVVMLVVGTVYLRGVDSNSDPKDVQESLVASQTQSPEESGESKPVEIWDGESQVLAQGDGEKTYPQFQVGDLAWFGDAQTDEEKVQKFTELAGTDAVQQVYSSTERELTDQNLTDNVAYTRIAERVTDPAVNVESPTQSTQYYKVVLADNKTILFEVWDASYLKITGVETIYQLCR